MSTPPLPKRRPTRPATDTPSSWISDLFGGVGDVFGQVASAAGQFFGASQQTRRLETQARIEEAKARQTNAPAPAPNRNSSTGTVIPPNYQKWGLWIAVAGLAFTALSFLRKR